MSKLKLNITMSLDGYVAGPNPTLEHPLGEGGERLHQWAVATRSFREMHGMGEGGTTGEDDAMVAAMFDGIGATIMGRRMFSGTGGPWGDDPWRGWWGDNPPFHMPVFVLTHHAREPLALEGGTTFHFVTDGIHSALEQARRAAGDKDIHLAGGADVVQQYLAAGLVDTMLLHVAPLLLGDGTRLFENTNAKQSGYECVRAIASPAVTHYTYRKSAAAQ